MRIVGVNGIATHGAGSIDLLLLELAKRGHVVLDIPLPKRHALSARWGGCSDGTIIASHSRDGDVIVAHSFGCLRAWYAHQVRDYRAIICIAPAMSDAQRWRYPDRVHCLYSPKDWAIRIGARLLLHPFGAAGSKGFEQDGITNVEYQCGHSEYFSPSLINGVADYVERVASG
jgi:hypothetical protein